jgi:hypothetical protein
MLEIMTLVSPINNIGSDIEFIPRGRLFIHIMNNIGPRIDPWGIPMFQCTPVRGKILSCTRSLYFNFVLY